MAKQEDVAKQEKGSRPRRPAVLLVGPHPPEDVEAALRDAGFRVLVALDAAQAERSATIEAPDAVVTELSLPDTDGVLFCLRLRHLTNAPILVYTESRREADAVLALRLGADSVVRKPTEATEIVARVHALMRLAGAAG